MRARSRTPGAVKSAVPTRSRPVAEPHDELGTRAWNTHQFRKLRPKSRDLDGLVDKRCAQSKARRRQRETLASAAHRNPACLVLPLVGEDGDPGGTIDQAGVYGVLGHGREEEVESRSRQGAGQGGIAACDGEQSVPLDHRVSRIEA